VVELANFNFRKIKRLLFSGNVKQLLVRFCL